MFSGYRKRSLILQRRVLLHLHFLFCKRGFTAYFSNVLAIYGDL